MIESAGTDLFVSCVLSLQRYALIHLIPSSNADSFPPDTRPARRSCRIHLAAKAILIAPPYPRHHIRPSLTATKPCSSSSTTKRGHIQDLTTKTHSSHLTVLAQFSETTSEAFSSLVACSRDCKIIIRKNCIYND